MMKIGAFGAKKTRLANRINTNASIVFQVLLAWVVRRAFVLLQPITLDGEKRLLVMTMHIFNVMSSLQIGMYLHQVGFFFS